MHESKALNVTGMTGNAPLGLTENAPNGTRTTENAPNGTRTTENAPNGTRTTENALALTQRRRCP